LLWNSGENFLKYYNNLKTPNPSHNHFLIMEKKENPQLILDPWQKEVLVTTGNKCICSGRQSGKSTIISRDAAEFAISAPNKSIMIIAAVERQAYLLFEKVLSYIYINHKTFIKKGKDRPTKSQLKLTNGSIIRCLPTGDSGYESGDSQ